MEEGRKEEEKKEAEEKRKEEERRKKENERRKEREKETRNERLVFLINISFTHVLIKKIDFYVISFFINNGYKLCSIQEVEDEGMSLESEENEQSSKKKRGRHLKERNDM